MRISPTIWRYRPSGDEKIPATVLRYASARNRHSIHSLIVREFKKSGITQAQLARRLGSTPDLISRLLGRPRNIEVDTLSEAIFAISGGYLELSVRQPATKAADDPASEAATTETNASNLVLISAAENTYKGTIAPIDENSSEHIETSNRVETTYASAA